MTRNIPDIHTPPRSKKEKYGIFHKNVVSSGARRVQEMGGRESERESERERERERERDVAAATVSSSPC